jgi:hypothetical protein
MAQEKAMSPFKIGDRLIFSPDERTVGWIGPTFEKVHLKPGDSGVVTRIKDGMYIYLDNERGGFHWECFKRANWPPCNHNHMGTDGTFPVWPSGPQSEGRVRVPQVAVFGLTAAGRYLGVGVDYSLPCFQILIHI